MAGRITKTEQLSKKDKQYIIDLYASSKSRKEVQEELSEYFNVSERQIREYAKQNMYSLNAVGLTKSKIDELNGQYAVIFGIAGISKTIVGDSIKLLFKVNQDVRFSVFIAPSQVQYFIFDESKIAKFAIFGKVKKAGKFLNIEIRSTRDLVIED